jgi:hypothetical protein
MVIKLKDMERVQELEKEKLRNENEKNVMKAYFMKQLSYVTQRYPVLFIK